MDVESAPSLLESETRDVMKIKKQVLEMLRATVMGVARNQGTHAGGRRYSIHSYLKSRAWKEPRESPKRP